MEATEITFNTIWTGVSKEGPIRKEITFVAETQAEADVKFKKFVEVKNQSSFKKAVILGSCRPFAIDLDKETEKWERKNDREDMG